MKIFEKYIEKVDSITVIDILSYRIIHDRGNTTYLKFVALCKINGIKMHVTYSGLLNVNNVNYSGWDKNEYTPLQIKGSFSMAKSMVCKSWPFTYKKSEDSLLSILGAVIKRLESDSYEFKLR